MQNGCNSTQESVVFYLSYESMVNNMVWPSLYRQCFYDFSSESRALSHGAALISTIKVTFP